MKAIHNTPVCLHYFDLVVLYLKDTEKWKQFTTLATNIELPTALCCISKIQKNESNSQLYSKSINKFFSCVVSQRYRKMKAIHNNLNDCLLRLEVVLYLKDTEKWKQFTTYSFGSSVYKKLCCISKIQKNESNSQPRGATFICYQCCVVSQRYWKMKAIHNRGSIRDSSLTVVLYLKDTEKWKQFTTKVFW